MRRKATEYAISDPVEEGACPAGGVQQSDDSLHLVGRRNQMIVCSCLVRQRCSRGYLGTARQEPPGISWPAVDDICIQLCYIAPANGVQRCWPDIAFTHADISNDPNSDVRRIGSWSDIFMPE